MAGSKDAHIIVEIPVAEETQIPAAAMQHHPLAEISQSGGHLLLLKLWQREEELSGRRIGSKEARTDAVRGEIFQLCCFFFIFHGFFLTILFTSSPNSDACGRWWIPSALEMSTSIALIFLVQMKLCRYWKVQRQLQREKADGRALSRCIQELRMKGRSFDLSKDPHGGGRRMKSSSVEVKWRPLTWFSQNLLTVCLVCFAALLFPASKLVLCV
ncbi:uncharacterized protein LOC127797126 [Diospyros lotus]|uniref:uncharacterized protein LOC127797126 n=1 Tax=Diospyros lotus TaxID=55363 RepID=UPI0022535302|nr:uncharacterized protein LOC127797126 [Diospyros lotus]